MEAVLEFLRPLDESVALYLNSFANYSRVFDACVGYLTQARLFKFLPMVLYLWWMWFRPAGMPRHTRMVAEAILATVIALAIGQIAQTFMVERPRPLHDPSLGFIPPFTINPNYLRGWSSFPSDHVTAAAALATSICLFRSRAGIVFLAWTALLIGFPRIYAGYHYISDVVAGMFLGAAIALAVNSLWFMKKLPGRIEAFGAIHPGLLHAALFFILFEFAQLFDETRRLFGALKFIWNLG